MESIYADQNSKFKPTMSRFAQIVVGIIGMLLVYALFAGIKTCQFMGYAKFAHMGRPPEAITSAKAGLNEWPDELSATASLQATQGVELSAELEGKVAKINFESGQAVKAGDVLVELDSTVETSNLRGAQAMAEQARRNLSRAQELRSKNANSVADLDLAQANARDMVSKSESLNAVVAKKQIIAPFAGRMGIRMVNVGQYVNPGTKIVPLFALNPIYANFTVPQQDLSRLSVGQTVKLNVDTYKDQVFEGKITAVNPQIDDATRNVAVQATIENPDEKLRPGMFANISVILPTKQNVVVIPATSIKFAPYGDAVYVIEDMKDPEGKEYKGVRMQIVKLGPSRGDQVAVLTGLKGGEEIATSGIFKLSPGLGVTIDNSFAPPNEAAPKPADT